MTAKPDAFSPHIEATARFLWGDPNPRLSSKTELRWGAHGSRSVDIEKGAWYDHEAGEGGGVLALIGREANCKNGDALAFLRERVGIDLPDERPPLAVVRERKIVATYDYVDEYGELLFQVVRFDPKDFRQRRPDGAEWSWSTKGVRQIPYRLHDVSEAIAMDRTVFIAEGERDVDALWALGIPATCNAGGAGKWPASCSDALRGADVVLLPDNDDAGRNHSAMVGTALEGVAKRVRVLDLPGLSPKGDVSDWIADGGLADTLHSLVGAFAKAWGKTAPVSRFGAIRFIDLDSVVQRHDWLCDGLIFAGDFGLAYGASQSGKSFLSLDLGLAIARGVPFLGKACAKGAVIYQAGEGGKGLVQRLKAYRQHHRLYGADIPFVLLPSRVDLFAGDDENGIESFLSEVCAWQAWLTEPLACVFIDTWATATPGANENASEDVSRGLRNIARIQDTTDAAVIAVHHKNAGGEKPRGHTSLYANADTALEVIRSLENPKERTMKVAKVKDGEDGEKILFQLQSVEIGTYDSGKPITSCVIVPAEAGNSQTGKRDRISSGQYKFLKLLDDAIVQYGGILPQIADRIPYNMRGVDWSHFRDLYIQASGAAHADDALRQALKRDGDKLFNSGLINRHESWIWISDRGSAYL